MKIEQDSGAAGNLIYGYEPGAIRINAERYASSLVVTPNRVIPDWPPSRFDELERAHLDVLTTLEPLPEVAVLGTGDAHRFPAPRLLATLYEHRIGVEVMSTAAACRTYNILVGEDRPVAAALIMTAADDPTGP